MEQERLSLQNCDDVLTPQEAQQVLHIGRNTFYALVARKELPHLRVGKKIVIPKIALTRYLASAETFDKVTE